MKVNQIAEKIRYNLSAKLICLVIAIFLYMFHHMSLLDTKTFTVPLRIQEDGIVMNVGDVQKYVTVVIRADREQITALHHDDIDAYIVLDYITENGNYNVPVKLNLTDKILSLDSAEVRVKPETLNIKTEKKAVKFVPLEAGIVGEPAFGYEITDISINPSSVEIFGPESIVQNVDKIITEKIDITNLNRTLIESTSFVKPGSIIRIDPELKFAVTVKISPVIIEKTFSGIKINLTNQPETLELAKQTASELNNYVFSVKGPMTILNSYVPTVNTVQIDLRGLTEAGTYEFQPKFNLPSGLSVTSKSKEKITLEFEKIPEEISAEPEEPVTETDKNSASDKNAASNNSKTALPTEQPKRTISAQEAAKRAEEMRNQRGRQDIRR